MPRLNDRNTAEVLALAVQCAGEPLAGRRGRLPVPLQSRNAQAFRRFDGSRDSVQLLTLHSAKGLEFPLVFIAGLQALPMHGESAEAAARLLYVGMTRATHELVLSAYGTSSIVERVRAALADVARRFAADG